MLLPWNVTENLLSQKPLPCRAPPGFHRELWIAQREPDRRCPSPLAQRSTEPPTRWWEASAQNMAPMTPTAEGEEGGGIWLLHPQVRNNSSPFFNVKKINRNIWFDFKGGPVHHLSDHYYSPPSGPKEDRNWSPHVDGYELMVGVFSVASTVQKISSFETRRSHVFVAPRSGKTSKLSLQNWCRHRLSHQYARWSG